MLLAVGAVLAAVTFVAYFRSAEERQQPSREIRMELPSPSPSPSPPLDLDAPMTEPIEV